MTTLTRLGTARFEGLVVRFPPVLIGLAASTILLGTGCATTRPSGVTAAPASRSQQTLESRAAVYWKAKAAEDWPAVYPFLDPADTQGAPVEQFVQWSSENEPFRIRSYEFQDFETDGPIGWAHLRYETTLRKFPDLPPQQSVQCQKWRLRDGAWYPVPIRELPNYPEPPSRRDRAAEQQLRKRFLASWPLRKERNWSTLYNGFTDPQDRGQVSEAEFAESEGLFEYIEQEVVWVEVIGNRGRIHVRYRHKLDDPSLTKLPPADAFLTESWVRVDNEWYRDLIRGRE